MQRINLIHPSAGDVTYILSAERPEHGPSGSRENVGAMVQLAGQLELIRADGLAHNVHPIAGAYGGRPEESMAIVGKDTFGLWLAVMRHARAFRQESILAVSPAGAGVLHYCGDGSADAIGQMVAVKDVADLARLDAYSIIRSTGEIFTFA